MAKTLTLNRQNDKVPDEAPEQAENPFGDAPPADEAANPFEDASPAAEAEAVPDADEARGPRDPLLDPAINDVVFYGDDAKDADSDGELRTIYMIERHAGGARIHYQCDRDGITSPRSCSLVAWR